MSNRRHVIILALILIMAGMGLFFYRAYEIGVPLEPQQTSEVWTLEARVSFLARSGPIRAELALPSEVPDFEILSENFISKGYGLDIRESDTGRSAIWTIRRAKGEQVLYYRVSVYRDAQIRGSEDQPAFPEVPVLDEPYQTAMTTIVDDARARSADVASFSANLLQRINSPSPDESVSLFMADVLNPQDKVRVAQTLLAGARIPTRVASGVRLGAETEGGRLEPWLEVHNGVQWLYYDPDSGEQLLPKNFFAWHRGDGPLFSARRAVQEDVIINSRRNLVDSLEVATHRAMMHDSSLQKFSLSSLPLRAQGVYNVLLLIPIGVFIMVIMRNFVGVRTFGTFTPVLIALAFRETSLLNGIILFSLVVALGLAVRFYFERLHLLLVPRLASVLTVVVLMLLGISLLGNQLGFETGLSVALFPMVILTMVIERMSIVWEERGPANAMIEGLGSLLVAVLAFLVMSLERLEYLVFAFPELLFIMLALTLLAGRYTGYRLSELRRFKVLFNQSH